MTETEVKRLIMLNIDNFPGRFLANAAKDQVNNMVATWLALFRNEDAQMVFAAYLEALKWCEFPVAPANIFDKLRAAKKALLPDIEKEWQCLVGAAKYCFGLSSGFDYTGTSVKYQGLSQGQERRRDCAAALSNLSGLNREFIGTVSQLISLGQLSDRDQNFFFAQRYKPFAENYREREYVLMAFPQLLKPNDHQQLEAADRLSS